MTGGLLELMSDAGGPDVVGVDWRVPIDEARRRIGPRKALQGNLDPAVVLAGADIAVDRARAVLARNAGHPGHVFNLGHGVLPESDPGVLSAIVDVVHEERHGARVTHRVAVIGGGIAGLAAADAGDVCRSRRRGHGVRSRTSGWRQGPAHHRWPGWPSTRAPTRSWPGSRGDASWRRTSGWARSWCPPSARQRQAVDRWCSAATSRLRWCSASPRSRHARRVGDGLGRRGRRAACRPRAGRWPRPGRRARHQRRSVDPRPARRRRSCVAWVDPLLVWDQRGRLRCVEPRRIGPADRRGSAPRAEPDSRPGRATSRRTDSRPRRPSVLRSARRHAAPGRRTRRTPRRPDQVLGAGHRPRSGPRSGPPHPRTGSSTTMQRSSLSPPMSPRRSSRRPRRRRLDCWEPFRSPRSVLVSLVYDPDDVTISARCERDAGTGGPGPRSDGRVVGIGASGHTSAKGPVVLRASLGRHGADSAIELPDDRIEEIVRRDLRTTMDHRGSPGRDPDFALAAGLPSVHGRARSTGRRDRGNARSIGSCARRSVLPRPGYSGLHRSGAAGPPPGCWLRWTEQRDSPANQGQGPLRAT